MNELTKGCTLQGGKYTIVKSLGQGSFGITYLATTTMFVEGRLGRIETAFNVAIKEFFMREVNQRGTDGSISGLTEGTLAYNYAQKFKKEAEKLAEMHHSNIVKVMDFIEENNTFYYVMEFVDGEDLSKYMKGKPLGENEAISIIRDVACALQYMHEEHKMLHLDLKPGNIMRRRSDGHIYIIDFGLSKHYNDDGQPDTSTTIGLGTEGYAPIEQGKRTTAQNSFRPTIDVYALGGTLFKMLTGETPPSASDILEDDELLCEIMKKHEVNPPLQEIIKKAMMPSARKRTASVVDFMESINSHYCDVSIAGEITQIDFIPPYSNSQPVSRDIHAISKSSKAEEFPLGIFDNQNEFVDMGVSVEWGNMNMGAGKITDSGQFYKGIDINNVHNWDSISKDFGGSSSDPVTNVMGKSFRLPSKQEWKELIDQCEWKWTEVDGVSGYVVTARNGNRLFLPNVGGYWSCTKGESEDFQCVWYLFFNSYDIDLVYNVYTILRCIRPVHAKIDLR